ncbi:hypothetical protein [Pseudomonas sp. Kh13]|uniref:hypothetical protein n=1 Tax=Pseudomonas sp. Kh13 TaxID=2093744 RepID=UPI0011843FEF|nr:hypothetical protein [Pseudomonas sp. Kh13]
MLVYVPPPPSMTVRNPTTQEMRHHIDGLKGAAPLEELKFAAGTLLVIEVKTTLGKSKTPGFLDTQRNGGSADLRRIQRLVQNQSQGWNPSRLIATDPNFIAKLNAVDNARKNGSLRYLHAQVFFDSKGNLSNLPASTTGIQLNPWN